MDSLFGDDNYSTYGDVYDPSSGTFGPPIQFATKNPGNGYVIGRGWHTLTLLASGQALMAGGAGFDGDQGPDGIQATAELFDPVANAFSTTGKMTIPRQIHRG
jgi:hypothetical protein